MEHIELEQALGELRRRAMIAETQFMKLRVIDEESRRVIEANSEGYVYGVVHISKDYAELGWFKSSPDNIVINVTNDLPGDNIPNIGISREALPELIWSNILGLYITPYNLTEEQKVRQTVVRGQGRFPYKFPKRYEAAESFHLFNGAQKVLENVKYPLADKLHYTFGLEFETSMGYIPQHKCFRDGLIPLRDGSISGIEYSTVVLEGNRGLNLLKQQLSTLKKYTVFNKECALHIHMGRFPVDPIFIYALYALWYVVERDMLDGEYVPRLTYNTAEYKANNKDYCKLLEQFDSFESLFKYITGKNYMGSLTQPHPCDIEKKAKWNIRTRYYGLNLVNMLCYNGPKTVEFRFLRPTFNYRKILLWLYILNAVLLRAERFANEWKKSGHCNTTGMMEWIFHNYHNITYMLSKVYSSETMKYLKTELLYLRMSVEAQSNNGDYYGRDTLFEDELFV